MEPDARSSPTTQAQPAGSVSAAAPPAPVLDTPFNGALQPAADPGGASGALLDQVSTGMAAEDEPALPKRPVSRRRLLGVGLIVAGGVAAGLLSLRIITNNAHSQEARYAPPSAALKIQQVPLASLSQRLGTVTPAAADNAVTVNGQLQITNSLVLQPSVPTAPAVIGQIYYDSATNNLAYYNGKQYVSLQGGNTYVTNKYSGNVTNITNNTYVTNNSGGGFGGSGTPGTLALFASSASLGDSLLSQDGSAVSIASNSINIGTGTAMGTIQGVAAGGLNLITAGAAGVSGGITITSGDSSTTASGNVTVDTGAGFISGTVIGDLGFEDDTADDVVPWFGDTIATSSVEAHSGTYSLAVTDSGGSWGIQLDSNDYSFPAVAGHHYVFSAWWRAATTSRQISGSIIWIDSGKYEIGSLSFTPVTDNAGSWTEITASGAAPAGTTGAYFEFTGPATSGETHYIDDIEATDLSSSAAVSSLSLGATNAQSVSIGNLNELGTTTIEGGSGITIASGAGPLSESGGAITITGSAASAIGTSAGSLTLDAGGGTGGGVTVSTQSDSTSAFQVQSAEGTLLLNVNSTDSGISLGTGAGSAIGYTSVGPWDGGGIRGSISAQKVTTIAGGDVTSMSAYIGTGTSPNNLYQFAIYADNGSGTAPGAYIASSAVGTLDAPTRAWYTLSVNATLSANTVYWLVYWQNWPGSGGTDNSFTYSPGGGSSLEVSGASTWAAGPDNGMPDTFPAISSSDTAVASLYATFASAGPALTINQYGTMTQNGAALFQDPTDSTQALQVEDNLGNVLLAVDTADMDITIGGALAVTGNITIGGHIVTSGGTPGIVADSAVECGGSVTPTITGDDTAGTVSVTTGSGSCSAGDLVMVTFNTAYGATPEVMLTPVGADSQTLGAYLDASGTSASGFTIGSANTPAASTTYSWNYQVLQ